MVSHAKKKTMQDKPSFFSNVLGMYCFTDRLILFDSSLT